MMPPSSQPTPGRPRRRGPRAEGDARADIVDAARTLFATQGYDATSVRAIARQAGVDPALVHHYFDGKPGVFFATIEIQVDPMEAVERIIDGPAQDAGPRLVSTFLSMWDTREDRDALVAMIRSVLASGQAPELNPLRQFVLPEIIMRICRGLHVPDPERSAGLVASQMLGLILTRYVLELPQVSSIPAEQIVATVGPTIQAYLFPDGG